MSGGSVPCKRFTGRAQTALTFVALLSSKVSVRNSMVESVIPQEK